MLSLNFTLDGLTKEEFELQLDNAIALHNPPTAIALVEDLIKTYNIKCIEVEKYLNNSQQVHGTSYQRSPAFLIYGTYSRIRSCSRARLQLLDPLAGINKFKLWNSEKCCPYCLALSKTTYTRKTLPELPHHPGCECMLAPIFDWEDNMDQKCAGCDTLIPPGAMKCPMCGAPFNCNPGQQIQASAPQVVPPSPETHYHHHTVHQAAPVVIEKTGKKWKKMYLWSCLFGFFGFSSCVAAAGGEPSAAPFMGVFFLVAIALYVYARFGAWWHHG